MENIKKNAQWLIATSGGAISILLWQALKANDNASDVTSPLPLFIFIIGLVVTGSFIVLINILQKNQLQRIQAEQALIKQKEAELELQNINKQLTRAQIIDEVGSWEWDLETDAITISDKLYKIYGLSKEGVTIGDILAFTHPDDVALVQQKARNLRNVRETLKFEFRIIRPDRQVRWLYVFSELTDYGIKKRFGIIKDITDRKRFEIQSAVFLKIAHAANTDTKFYDLLQLIHQQIGLLIDVTNFYVALYDTQKDLYTFPYWVDQVDQDFGPQRLNNSPTDQVRRSNKSMIIDHANLEKFSVEEAWEIAGPLPRIWMGAPLRNPENQVIGVVAVQSYDDKSKYSQHELEILDIATEHIGTAIERKRNHDFLEASEERFRKLLESAPSTILIINRNGLIEFANKATASSFGYEPQELIGQPIEKLIPTDFRALHTEAYSSARMEPLRFDSDFWGLHANGEQFPIEILLNFTYINEELLSVAFISDLSIKHKALKLSIEKERTQTLTRLTERITHEFKTPLSIIGTSSYLLSRTKEEAKQTRHLSKIKEQINEMTILIDALVLMIRLRESPDGNREQFKLNHLIHAVEESVQLQLKEKSQNLTIALDEKQAAIVEGDSRHVHQAIKHILENAIRYTPAHGDIIINMQVAGNQAIIEITDTGIGIDENDLPHIFERFYRVDSSGTTRGLGLGLTIVKAIIIFHGGEIVVKSQPGRGTTFKITLPIVTIGQPSLN